MELHVQVLLVHHEGLKFLVYVAVVMLQPGILFVDESFQVVDFVLKFLCLPDLLFINVYSLLEVGQCIFELNEFVVLKTVVHHVVLGDMKQLFYCLGHLVADLLVAHFRHG